MDFEELMEIIEWHLQEYPECDYAIESIKNDIIEHKNDEQGTIDKLLFQIGKQAAMLTCK